MRGKKQICRRRLHTQPSSAEGSKRSAAAAKEKNDQGNDDDPSAVVVEQMAKAVIHKACHRTQARWGGDPLSCDMRGFSPTLSYYAEGFGW